MSLPSDHPYKDGAPLKTEDAGAPFGVFIISASNGIGVEVIDYDGVAAQDQYHNVNQIKKFTHDHTIVDYADPWNAAGSATYTRINEGGAYSPYARVAARLSEYTDAQIVIGGGGESATPLYQGLTETGAAPKRNASDSEDINTRYGQYVTLAKAMKAAGVEIKMIVVDQFGRDAAIGNLDSIWYSSFEYICNNFPTDIGAPDAKIINVGAGPFPTGLTYPTWLTIQTIQKDIDDDTDLPNARNVNLDTDGLNLTLATHYMADKLHYNTAGCIAVGDGIITEAETLGVITKL